MVVDDMSAACVGSARVDEADKVPAKESRPCQRSPLTRWIFMTMAAADQLKLSALISHLLYVMSGTKRSTYRSFATLEGQ